MALLTNSHDSNSTEDRMAGTEDTKDRSRRCSRQCFSEKSQNCDIYKTIEQLQHVEEGRLHLLPSTQNSNDEILLSPGQSDDCATNQNDTRTSILEVSGGTNNSRPARVTNTHVTAPTWMCQFFGDSNLAHSEDLDGHSGTRWLEDPTWMSGFFGDSGFMQANNPNTQLSHDGMEDSAWMLEFFGNAGPLELK